MLTSLKVTQTEHNANLPKRTQTEHNAYLPKRNTNRTQC